MKSRAQFKLYKSFKSVTTAVIKYRKLKGSGWGLEDPATTTTLIYVDLEDKVKVYSN